MKKFVFIFCSRDFSKFKYGEELFNIIITALIFEQSVFLVYRSSSLSLLYKDLSFLSDFQKVKGNFRIIVDEKEIPEDSDQINLIESLPKNKIQKIINEADYCSVC